MRPALLASTLLLCSPALAAEDREARLDKGEVLASSENVPGTRVPLAQVEAVIHAPPEKVWAYVSDCARYSTTFQRILASRELAREGNTVTCEVTTDLPFPLADLTSVNRAVHTVEPGKRWLREWKLVSGDYDFNQGSWELVPFRGDAGRTLARYRLHAQPKVGLPQGLVQAAQERNLPGVMHRLRELTRAR